MTRIITGKHLSRRTLLKGAGAAIALPMLDAMRPALASPANESPCTVWPSCMSPTGSSCRSGCPARRARNSHSADIEAVGTVSP